MLHRIVKMVSSYVSSVCERKHLDLDNQNYTVEIIVSTRQANGDLVSVTNHINVAKGLPHTYSEIVRNAVGQTIDFVAGASGNKRKSEQDKLVAAFSEAKASLVGSDFSKAIVQASEILAQESADGAAIQARLDHYTTDPVETPAQTDSTIVIGPDVKVGEFIEPEVKAKKTRVKKSKKVENEPATA